MRQNLSIVYPAVAFLIPVAAVFGWTAERVRSEAAPLPARSGVSAAAEWVPRELRLVVAAEGNEARYRVREQLAGIEFPSDAAGVTRAVTGTLLLADDGSVVRDESRFEVDLTGLTSDSNRRDGYIQRRTLETERYPDAEFVPTRITGLATPPQSAGELNLRVLGDLTIHGTTKAVTWEVRARAEGGTYTGMATTAFTFEDFGMTKSRVGRVLSVADTIRLEYDFRLVPPPADR